MKAEASPVPIPIYRGNHLVALVGDYLEAKAAAKAATDREADLRAAILAKLGERPALRVGSYLLRLRWVRPICAHKIVADDVGKTLKGRKGHYVLEVSTVDVDLGAADAVA